MTLDTRNYLWTGSYTPDSAGSGEGIGLLAAPVGRPLESLGVAAMASSPSFLATHPAASVLYAVGEFERTLRAFRVVGDDSGSLGPALEPLGESWPTGDAGCHVAVDPLGRFLVVTCWGDGQVLLFELDAEGAIVSRRSAPAATDPHEAHSSQTAEGEARPSRAHASLMLADDLVLTTDLGLDLLRLWRYTADEGLVAITTATLPFGSGPRHLALHPDGRILVCTEYSLEVFCIEIGTAPDNDVSVRILQSTEAIAGGAATGDTGAHIELSADGSRAYFGVRGSNRIAILAVDEAGAHPLAAPPSGGDWPRHHLVHDGLLHIAHERGSEITTFALDAATGLLGEPLGSLHTGSPSCIVPAR